MAQTASSESAELLSFAFSIISVFFYSIVYIPQFYSIYKNKSSKGVSIWMILTFCLADGLSLVGTILLGLTFSLVVMGWYHCIVGISMLLAVFFYKRNRSIYEYTFVFGFVFTAVITYVLVQVFLSSTTYEIPGSIVGWFSTSMYIIGRLPQIYLNYKRKSTEGLSILMFLFSILGNVFYLVCILTFSVEPEYIFYNMPWIILVVVTVSLDFFVMYQWKLYSDGGSAPLRRRASPEGGERITSERPSGSDGGERITSERKEEADMKMIVDERAEPV